MDDTQRIEDQIRQKAHAQSIQDRRDQQPQARRNEASGLPPGMREIIAQIAAKAVDAGLSKLTIQSSGNIIISGTGMNMTIGMQPLSFTGSGTCNGDGTVTFTISPSA